MSVRPQSSYEEFNFPKNVEKVGPLNNDVQINENSKKVKSICDAEFVLQNANKPFWKILRLSLGITIVLTFIGLLAFIIAVIVIHPGCEKVPDNEWWRKSLIYKVELESVKSALDGNSNNVFKVMEENVAYFIDNKADAILLSSIVNFDKNFMEIQESYGSLQDFKNMAKAFHDKNIKVVLDFNPNSISDQSEWFLNSKNNVGNYRDFFIWSNTIPNNWKSVDSDTVAWSSANGAFYYHKYESTKPDLNYRNPVVVEELLKSIEFWLDVGIDGINLIDSSYLTEDYLLRDETYNNQYTQHQRETFYLISEIKNLISEYNANKSKEITLMAGLSEELKTNDLGNNFIQRYYGGASLGGIDLLVFYKLFKVENSVQLLNGNSNFIKRIDDILNKFNTYDKSPVWQLDRSNINFPTSSNLTNLLQMGLSFLPGTAIIQLGKQDYNILSKKQNATETLFSSIAKLRDESKSLKYSKIEYNTEGGTLNDCLFTELIRYFDGENTYSFHFDLNSCPSILLKSNLIKGNTVNVRYSSDKNIVTGDKVKFDSSGKTSITVNSESFLVLSWPFEPKDINDIL